MFEAFSPSQDYKLSISVDVKISEVEAAMIGPWRGVL